MTEYNTVAILRVMPESPELDKEALKKSIENGVPQNMKIHKIEEEPIAFGIVALNAFVLLNDKEGGVENIEKEIKDIKDVSEVDTTDVRRLL
ncbi:MAG: elongation factor 1-beta [Euryarchaeota archaeon]|nr:elongation factor 1-beta [Euryarchaeota archaeon]